MGSDPVRVSPSKLEAVDRCALRWVLEAGGATAPDAQSQSLGTLVHSIAQTFPAGTHHELAAELDRRWPELGLRPGWPATSLRRRADAMIGRLAEYLKDSGEAVAVEAPFQVRLGGALLAGVVDRLERTDDGLRVADLKTGKSAPSRAETETNPQLGAYQLALTEGAFDLPDVPDETPSAGARLVFVGMGRSAALRSQAPLQVRDDGSSWVHDMVDEVASTMSGATFGARQNDLCSVCPVRRSCPVQVEGRQVL
ncbi:RecB family exonuclease [Paraoerskovia sediminicola]|uniref:RecB family exonuclease n=1 Tax=Paraoerskovia sediminicola TaxID=1138587 RepID=UPI0025732D9E|nr:PD-(D/E)XK nuclease family protein [Paraoerskovia sediminicola]